MTRIKRWHTFVKARTLSRPRSRKRKERGGIPAEGNPSCKCAGRDDTGEPSIRRGQPLKFELPSIMAVDGGVPHPQRGTPHRCRRDSHPHAAAEGQHHRTHHFICGCGRCLR
ncbi:unnamed protein product [Ectocarpus sp. 12 AP-2014]